MPVVFEWLVYVVGGAFAVCFAYIVLRGLWQIVTGAHDEHEPDADADGDERPCSECGFDLRATPARCPECGAMPFDRRAYLQSLAGDWPDDPIDPRTPVPGESLVVLMSTEDGDEAELLREQLQKRGVACLARHDILAEQFGAVSRRTPIFRVLVYAEDAPMAREYLWRARGIPKEMLPELREREAARQAPGP